MKLKTIFSALFLALLFQEPNVAFAMTSAPFDVGGLILWGGGYLLGLIILTLTAIKSKMARITLLIYLAAPISYIYYEGKVGEEHQKQVMVNIENRRNENTQAFAQFCKTRKQQIFSNAHIGKNLSNNERSIQVQIKAEVWDQLYLNAGALVYYLQRDKNKCDRTGIAFIDGEYESYSIEKKGIFREFKQYPACIESDGKGAVISATKARYKLLLGEDSTSQPIPTSQSYSTTYMSRSSVHVIDLKNNKVLAKDTIYSIHDKSILDVCPRAQEQIAELLLTVFNSSEHK